MKESMRQTNADIRGKVRGVLPPNLTYDMVLRIRINKHLFYLHAPVIIIHIMMCERKNLKQRNKLIPLTAVNWRYEIRINTFKNRKVVTP